MNLLSNTFWLFRTCVILFGLGFSLSTQGHTSLQSSIPADGQTLTTVSELKLQFGDTMRLMRLTLTDSSGQAFPLDFQRSASAQVDFTIAITQPLPVAEYKVEWVGLGEDGHRMTGEFSFTIATESVATQTTDGPAMFTGLDNAAAETVTAFHAALKAADHNTLLQLLAEDVIVFEGGGVERSKAEYQQHHMTADMAFIKDLQTEVLEHHVRISGDTAVSLRRTKVSGYYKDKPINHSGLETITLAKQDGRWQINHIHWSH